MAIDLLQVASRTPYPPQAFLFLQKGLDATARRLHGPAQEEGNDHQARHISGQDLAHGLKDFAIEQYGLLAPLVFKHWHIHKTADFGHMVFALIEAGLLSKTDEDHLEDFENVFDFRDAFPKRLD